MTIEELWVHSLLEMKIHKKMTPLNEIYLGSLALTVARDPRIKNPNVDQFELRHELLKRLTDAIVKCYNDSRKDKSTH